MTDYSRDLAGTEHYHNAQVERPERPSRAEWDDPPPWIRKCPYSGEMCQSDLCIPVCQHEDVPWDPRDPADDEPEHSCFDRTDDPMFDILRMAAAGAEVEARDTYGDRAITRVLSEEGL